MDLQQKGYLCYAEFCQSCKEMLFNGDVRSLWREFDASGEGIITFKEFPDLFMSVENPDIDKQFFSPGGGLP